MVRHPVTSHVFEGRSNDLRAVGRRQRSPARLKVGTVPSEACLVRTHDRIVKPNERVAGERARSSLPHTVDLAPHKPGIDEAAEDRIEAGSGYADVVGQSSRRRAAQRNASSGVRRCSANHRVQTRSQSEIIGAKQLLGTAVVTGSDAEVEPGSPSQGRRPAQRFVVEPVPRHSPPLRDDSKSAEDFTLSESLGCERVVRALLTASGWMARGGLQACLHQPGGSR